MTDTAWRSVRVRAEAEPPQVSPARLPAQRQWGRVLSGSAGDGGVLPALVLIALLALVTTYAAVSLLSAALGETLRRLVARYPTDATPATIRVIVSPLVTWIWLGALIVFAGGLIAIWPMPAGATRRVTAVDAARVARELGRA